MNLSELKNNIDFTIDSLQSHQKPDEIQILVTLAESSMGARAAANVTYCGLGIDWEHGQYRIETDKKLVNKGNTLKDAKPMYVQKFEKRDCYFCSACGGGSKVSKDDKYCRCCGQRITSENAIRLK